MKTIINNTPIEAEEYRTVTWRLILSPPERGAWNMAVDETLLEGMQRSEALPVLRLYAWEPPCLSLGYAQPISDVDFEKLNKRGWELVRRPTGGRAILHTDELTYAVIGPHSEPRLAGGVLESYRRLSQALLEALRGMHARAESNAMPGNSNDADKGPVCFEAPSNYEITIAAKKLIGSAQARKKEGVLQHGTLPLYGDLSRITQVLNFPSEMEREQAAQRLLERATTLESALGKRITWEQASRAFIAAFERTFKLRLVSDELTDAERVRAAQIQAEKYDHRNWNLRV